jgi:hypothetical protein
MVAGETVRLTAPLERPGHPIPYLRAGETGVVEGVEREVMSDETYVRLRTRSGLWRVPVELVEEDAVNGDERRRRDRAAHDVEGMREGRHRRATDDPVKGMRRDAFAAAVEAAFPELEDRKSERAEQRIRAAIAAYEAEGYPRRAGEWAGLPIFVDPRVPPGVVEIHRGPPVKVGSEREGWRARLAHVELLLVEARRVGGDGEKRAVISQA